MYFLNMGVKRSNLSVSLSSAQLLDGQPISWSTGQSLSLCKSAVASQSSRQSVIWPVNRLESQSVGESVSRPPVRYCDAISGNTDLVGVATTIPLKNATRITSQLTIFRVNQPFSPEGIGQSASQVSQLVTQSVRQSLTYSITHSLIHSRTQAGTHARTHARTHSLTHSLLYTT